MYIYLMNGLKKQTAYGSWEGYFGVYCSIALQLREKNTKINNTRVN